MRATARPPGKGLHPSKARVGASTLFALTLACSSALSAQGYVYKTGSDLLVALLQDTGLEHGYALYYIAGVVDTANGSPSREGFCFDLTKEQLKLSEIADVVRPFLEKNPQMQERPGSVLVAAALAERWPCR